MLVDQVITGRGGYYYAVTIGAVANGHKFVSRTAASQSLYERAEFTVAVDPEFEFLLLFAWVEEAVV